MPQNPGPGEDIEARLFSVDPVSGSTGGQGEGLTMQENPYLQKVTRTFRELEVIFEEGSHGDEMYIVHSGLVKLVRKSPAGEMVIALIKPGEFFAEMALVDNAPRSVSAVAGTDQTRLLVLDRDKFLFLISHQPAFALTIMHVLCQRIRDMNEKLAKLDQMQQ
jgi:CRP/FNR family cyclic AMP-dependent transcriptional regulator